MSQAQKVSLNWHQKFFTNPANALTSSRIVLTGVALWLDYMAMPWLALATFVVAAITDYLDGLVAKNWKDGKYGSDFGKAYDPVADKIMVWALLILIIVETWSHGEKTVALLLILSLAVLAVRELRVAAIKGRHWKKTGHVTSAIQSGRVAMVLLCIAIGVLLLPGLDSLWRFAPFMVAFAASMYSWWQYHQRYGHS